MSVSEGAELVQAFRFKVTLTAAAEGPPALGDGYFSECTGLEVEADIKEYLEGGRNDGVVRRVGRAKLSPIVLKRGMFLPDARHGSDPAFWNWITGMLQGTLPIPRYNGLVEVRSPNDQRTVAAWSFERGLPSKVVGPVLNARTGEIAIEELHIAHERLLLKKPAPQGGQP